MSENHKIGQLALRVEGEFWNAYYAPPTTMDGALYLGQIALKLAQTDKRKNAFMALMRDSVADLIKERTGARVAWPDGPRAAPEHERAGRA